MVKYYGILPANVRHDLPQMTHHDNIARVAHFTLCNGSGPDRGKTWYDNKPKGIMESDNAKKLMVFYDSVRP